MDDKSLIWHMYVDNRTQAQLHEAHRMNGTGLIGSGATVIIGFMSQDGKFNRADAPLCLILIVIGIFGYFFCLKAYERMRLHLNRCSAFLKLLDDMDDEHDIVSIKNEADKKTEKEHPFSSKLKLRIFWQGIHVLITLAGMLILIDISLYG